MTKISDIIYTTAELRVKIDFSHQVIFYGTFQGRASAVVY